MRIAVDWHGFCDGPLSHLQHKPHMDQLDAPVILNAETLIRFF